MDGAAPVKSPSLPPEKKAEKDKPVTKAKKAVASVSSTDGKIAELDLQWSEQFNRLEALLLAKSFPPSFSSDVRVTPSHSPPPNVGKDTEPFFQPSSTSSLQRTSPDLSASKQLLAGKQPSQESDSTKRTGPDIKDAEKLQSAGKLVTERPGTGSISTRCTGPDSKVAAKHQSAGKPSHNRPVSFKPTSAIFPHRLCISGAAQII